MSESPNFTSDRFARRKDELRMSFSALAARSGVSEPTVKRILGGHLRQASFVNVASIASALGIPLGLSETDADEFCREQARKQAERIARLVQGTSALEGQAVEGAAYRRLVEKSYHELLAGPRRRLWSEP
ncbi:hypothetical protein PHYC_03643 [Phycisphaerales bacterium]|nr:hypothetical protein PHYC_03643 [Phycisphaerales bacterium]